MLQLLSTSVPSCCLKDPSQKLQGKELRNWLKGLVFFFFVIFSHSCLRLLVRVTV